MTAPTMPAPSQLAEALYRDEGMSIFPARRDKRPRVEQWEPFQERPPTLEEFEGWMERPPPCWAIVTGRLNRLIVLDFDRPEREREPDGLNLLRELGLAAHVITPSGGAHVYVEYPPSGRVPKRGWKSRRRHGGLTLTAWGQRYPGVQGDGAYAVIAGDTAEGSYRWTDALLAPGGRELRWGQLPEELRRDLVGFEDDPAPRRRATSAIPSRSTSFSSPVSIGAGSDGEGASLDVLMAGALDLDGYRHQRARRFVQDAMDASYSADELEPLAVRFASLATERDPSDHPYRAREFRATVRGSLRKRERLARLGAALVERGEREGLRGAPMEALRAIAAMALEAWDTTLPLAERELALRMGMGRASARRAKRELVRRGYLRPAGRTPRGAGLLELLEPDEEEPSPLTTPLEPEGQTQLPNCSGSILTSVREADAFRPFPGVGKGPLNTFIALLRAGSPMTVEDIAAQRSTCTAQTIKRYHLPRLVELDLVAYHADGTYSATAVRLEERLDRAAIMLNVAGKRERDLQRYDEERRLHRTRLERRADRLSIGQHRSVEVASEGVIHDADHDQEHHHATPSLA